MSELIKRIEQEKTLVIAICEMKHKKSKERETPDYTIPGYSIHPVNLDPDSNTGRGVAVYTHCSIDKSVIQIQPDLGYEEACLLEIRIRGGDLLLFGCFYRSPTPTSTSDENNENLNRLLQCISKKNYSHKCFVGDFNYRDINWLSWTTPHSEYSKEAKFIETIHDCYLHQHIQESTRRRGNDDPSLIDLVFTDEVMQVSDIAHHAPLGKSDHSVITFRFNCYLDYSKPKERYVYEKADFEAMRNHLVETNWEEEYLALGDNKTIEDLWSSLKSKLLDLRNQFVPKKTIAGTPSWRKMGSFPISKPLQEAIRNKRISHRRWMSVRSRIDAEAARLTYAKARNKVKRMMRKAKREFERGIGLKSKSNPKAFWSHIRNRLKTKTGVAPLLENNDDINSTKFDDKEKANILQKQFSSVFTREPEDEIPKLDRRSDASVSNLLVMKAMVQWEILKLNINKSCGPDDVHPRLLIELVDNISQPIALVLNKTMEHGEIPSDWKMAFVSPIYKKGARNRAENYRPISLTSIVCKIMESFIKEAVMNHIKVEKLLSPKQYGFISGRSTATQLLRYLDKCIETIVAGGVVDTIYLDFAKAFDTVPHRRLIGKLESYGINGNILNWIKAFLRGRSQVVKVNGVESESAPVLSGIPQGSVLGPILFVIYINNLPEAVRSEVFLYADDTKILHQITSKDDALTLQSDLDSLELWSKKWLLEFHPDKCHVLTLGKFDNIKHTHRYSICKHELEHVFEEKDLGVTIDSELKFEEHMSEKVKKANAIVGLIRRSFSFLDCALFKKLFTTFVRPHLEYAQAVWAPHLKKHINMIENVQIRATKLVDGLNILDYAERLKKLDLPTLAYRRARGDMIELYKHFHKYDQDTLPHPFQPRNRVSRKHDFQLVWIKPKDGIRGLQTNSFYYRTIKTWNDLPKEVVNAKDINSFKEKLDEAWKENPIKFNHIQSSDS